MILQYTFIGHRRFTTQEGAWVAQRVKSLDLTAHTSLSSIQHGFAPSFVDYKKGCTRLVAARDKVHQLLAQGWWWLSGYSASSTTKTGRHEWCSWNIAESDVKHKNSNYNSGLSLPPVCGINKWKLFQVK